MSKPCHLLLVKQPLEDDDGSIQYYIYTMITNQVLVFQRNLSDLCPTSIDMIKVLSTKKSSHLNSDEKKNVPQLGEYPDIPAFFEVEKRPPFVNIQELNQGLNEYKNKILQ